MSVTRKKVDMMFVKYENLSVNVGCRDIGLDFRSWPTDQHRSHRPYYIPVGLNPSHPVHIYRILPRDHRFIDGLFSNGQRKVRLYTLSEV